MEVLALSDSSVLEKSVEGSFGASSSFLRGSNRCLGSAFGSSFASSLVSALGSSLTSSFGFSITGIESGAILAASSRIESFFSGFFGSSATGAGAGAGAAASALATFSYALANACCFLTKSGITRGTGSTLTLRPQSCISAISNVVLTDGDHLRSEIIEESLDMKATSVSAAVFSQSLYINAIVSDDVLMSLVGSGIIRMTMRSLKYCARSRENLVMSRPLFESSSQSSRSFSKSPSRSALAMLPRNWSSTVPVILRTLSRVMIFSALAFPV